MMGTKKRYKVSLLLFWRSGFIPEHTALDEGDIALLKSYVSLSNIILKYVRYCKILVNK